MQPHGIQFKKVEIDLIYSFLLRIPNFENLLNVIQLLAVKDPDNHIRLRVTELERLIIDNEVQYDKHYWTFGISPERVGLSPLLRVGRHRKVQFGESIIDRVIGQVTCSIKRKGPFEIITGLDHAKLEDLSNDKSAFSFPIDEYEILLRVMDNGMGTVTFKFVLELDQLEKYCRSDHNTKQRLLLKYLGMLPFIYATLTLGRAELSTSKDDIPFSKIGRQIENVTNYAGFKSLYHIFNVFLFKDIIETLRATGKELTNENLKGRNKTISNVSENSSAIESIDDELRVEVELHGIEDSKPWQTPYICIYADVDPDSTMIKQKGKETQPWWFCSDYVDSNSSPNTCNAISGKKIAINRCYKEVVFLLLRLYQWRYFLGVDALLKRVNSKKNNVKDEMHKVLAPPELFYITSQGRLFKDINLVWDSRYLMLYHKRSSVVLNCVEDSIPENGHRRRDFKELFRQSLLNSLEVVRAQWHAAVLVGLNLDSLIDKLSSSESSRDINILSEVANHRVMYSKLLRDPLSSGTDAAALAEVHERAAHDYQIAQLYSALRDKFQAVDSLISDQSMIQNILALTKI